MVVWSGSELASFHLQNVDPLSLTVGDISTLMYFDLKDIHHQSCLGSSLRSTHTNIQSPDLTRTTIDPHSHPLLVLAQRPNQAYSLNSLQRMILCHCLWAGGRMDTACTAAHFAPTGWLSSVHRLDGHSLSLNFVSTSSDTIMLISI